MIKILDAELNRKSGVGLRLDALHTMWICSFIFICWGCSQQPTKSDSVKQGEILNLFNQDAALVLSEFIYKDAPFPSCHASTIVQTQDRLVAAWFGGTDEKEDDVGIWVSYKKGDTWSDMIEVANGIESDQVRYPCWNPVLFQPQNGPLILFYKVGPSPREWWGMYTTSDDEGTSWNQPVRLQSGFLGPIKNKPVQLSDGSILCPSSTESKDEGWEVHLELTNSELKHWTKTKSLNDGLSVAAIQPTILTHDNSSIQILCRSQQGQIMESWSRDNGLTWSPLKSIELPNPNSGFDAVTLKQGGHLLVYNHQEKGRNLLNVALSDDGINWKATLILENQDGEYSYPAVIQSEDGLVHVTYTWNREKIKHAIIDPRKLISKDIVEGEWPTIKSQD